MTNEEVRVFLDSVPVGALLTCVRHRGHAYVSGASYRVEDYEGYGKVVRLIDREFNEYLRQHKTGMGATWEMLFFNKSLEDYL